MRDEEYILDICDRILEQKAKRQHRFKFLVGDPGKDGLCRSLPVDAFYEELQLVIEYRGQQHHRPTPFWDKRETVSGCSRGQQRKTYDQRRHEILPANGIHLIVLEHTFFELRSGRLKRDTPTDESVIRKKLAEFLPRSLVDNPDQNYSEFMQELVFEVIQEPDGGYVAEALGESIFTQGDTWEDLRSNVKEAVEAFYFDSPKPNNIRLHLVRDEMLAVG